MAPRVAIMNNGARKGADPDGMEDGCAIRRACEDLWQLHFAHRRRQGSQRARLRSSPTSRSTAKAQYLKVTAEEDGRVHGVQSAQQIFENYPAASSALLPFGARCVYCYTIYALCSLSRALFGALTASAQYKAVNPQVSKIVSEVSEERIADNSEEAGRVRDAQHFFIPGQSHARRRRGAQMDLRAVSQLQPAAGGQLRSIPLKKETTRAQSRIIDDVDLYNVVAVLPGTTEQGTADHHQRALRHHQHGPSAGRAARRSRATLPAASRDPNMRRSGRHRRRQRNGVRDGTGARSEPVRIREDAGVRHLRGRRRRAAR